MDATGIRPLQQDLLPSYQSVGSCVGGDWDRSHLNRTQDLTKRVIEHEIRQEEDSKKDPVRGGALRPATSHGHLCVKDIDGQRWDVSHVNPELDLIANPANPEGSTKHSETARNPEANQKELQPKSVHPQGVQTYIGWIQGDISEPREPKGGRWKAVNGHPNICQRRLTGEEAVSHRTKTKYGWQSARSWAERPKFDKTSDDRVFPTTCMAIKKNTQPTTSSKEKLPYHGPPGWSATASSMSEDKTPAPKNRSRCVSQTSVIPDTSTVGNQGRWNAGYVRPSLSYTKISEVSSINPPAGPLRQEADAIKRKRFTARRANKRMYQYQRSASKKKPSYMNSMNFSSMFTANDRDKYLYCSNGACTVR